ncbi:thioesterase family protein [Talaromyces stipitatus ATCC 10500]|uniref:Thioesterase family protein n=1 Tax=Talaromyces stipitatus (strain ATCC 10500 / CBS 375.48 / QM 6759 / NRRL 1006) TaxID=441959 RepID=B8LZG0_TALSN|nr:thioesterase family protein [Talaromyces stipitatus ATCC 10500]EED21713.1 thioesterase family protein [Talaromyces stipitatus ATCC 10500]
MSTKPAALSILQQSLNLQENGDTENSEYVVLNMPARVFKDYTDEDGYFAGTLGTKETIPFLVTLCRRNLEQEVSASLPTQPPPAANDPKSKTPFNPSRPPDTITLVSMSTPGLSGHPRTAHGGVIATLFDEAMSHTIEAHLSLSPKPSTVTRERDAIYTAQLNVRYRKPVYTPGLLVIRTWCIARDARKFWALSNAVQEEQEDDGGQLEWVKRRTISAEASSLWVVTRNEKL